MSRDVRVRAAQHHSPARRTRGMRDARVLGDRARLRRVDGSGNVDDDAGTLVVGSKEVTGLC